MRLPKWKAIVALLMALTLTSATFALAADYAAPADAGQQAVQADEGNKPGGSAVLLDVIIVRPLSFGSLILGSAVWLIAAPFALMADGTEGVKTVSRPLVVEPAKYTFKRSVGDL